ncbi:hypothetical protein C8J56DRAFT_1051473 [Mycena floridula]|nr:hypothetical protein C8J56DRAFT_1051473 [Mycena floridula]
MVDARRMVVAFRVHHLADNGLIPKSAGRPNFRQLFAAAVDEFVCNLVDTKLNTTVCLTQQSISDIEGIKDLTKCRFPVVARGLDGFVTELIRIRLHQTVAAHKKNEKERLAAEKDAEYRMFQDALAAGLFTLQDLLPQTWAC